MIIKTGIDIIEVERIKTNIEKYKDRFLNKVFTKKEIEYCESRKIQKYESYAGRFAAKEAIFKAISDILDNKYNIEWKDIEVVNNEYGKPYVNLKLEKFAKMKDINRVVNIDISISHIKDIAVANVVMLLK